MLFTNSNGITSSVFVGGVVESGCGCDEYFAINNVHIALPFG